MRTDLHLLIAGCALALSSAAARAQASEWLLTSDSSVRFVCAGEHIRTPAAGRFASIASELTLDPRDLRATRGAIVVILRSITSRDAAWDAMFRGAPFLMLDEHPESHFTVRAVEGPTSLADGVWTGLTLVGRLRVLGVTRPRRIRARARWQRQSGRLEVRGRFDIPWREFDIRVPDGWTRHFAGDRAAVSVNLTYERRPAGQR